MLTKEAISDKAFECGFADVGFTTAEPFASQRALLEERREEYGWAIRSGLDLIAGTDPATVLPGAKAIIVLIEPYFREAFPPSLERHFGRCYLDDDRMTGNRLGKRVKAFRSFLRDHGIDSKVPFHLPHRLAAARAGLGTFGKNCLFYSRKVAAGGSWVTPIALVVDRAFEPGRAHPRGRLPRLVPERLHRRLSHGRPEGSPAYRSAPLYLLSHLFRRRADPAGAAGADGALRLRVRPLSERLSPERALARTGAGDEPEGGGDGRGVPAGEAPPHGQGIFYGEDLAAHVLHVRCRSLAVEGERRPGHGKHAG